MKLKCIYTSFKLCTKTKQKQNTSINCNSFWWSCASEVDLRTEPVLIAVENQSWFADLEMTVISQGTHRIDSHFHWFFLLFLIVWICAFVYFHSYGRRFLCIEIHRDCSSWQQCWTDWRLKAVWSEGLYGWLACCLQTMRH